MSNQIKEGEFKKRLYPDPSVDDLIARGRVEEWLDEAHKEFPTYEMARIEYLRRIGHTQLQTGLDEAGVQLVLNELRDSWSLKWFGDSV